MMAAAPPQDEAKLLSDALATVKIQVVQMKRHLVCILPRTRLVAGKMYAKL